MMACARQFDSCQQTLARGAWGRPSEVALIDRSALIIGLGAVGQALATRLVALGMRVVASDVAALSETAKLLGPVWMSSTRNRLVRITPWSTTKKSL